MMSDFAPVAVGGETWFARSLATIAEDLRDCRPTVFFAVPRVWEKAQEAVLEKFGDGNGLQRLVIERYLALGEHVMSRHATAHEAPLWKRLPYVALDAAVGARIRAEMGLDRAHILITAAAPTHPDLIRWYHSIGLPIVELYGQTESCGPTTCNPPGCNRVGTVGQPLPGMRVLIAGDGASTRPSWSPEGLRYLTALLTLDGDALKRWADLHHKVADYEVLAGDPDLRAEIDRFVAEVNGKRSRVEHVRKYRLLPHELTVAEGELTPTLKVKRSVVSDHYLDLIDGMYADESVRTA